MAMKKIRLDFSKTEERSGWNTRSIPEGLHKMKIEGVEETEAQDGTDMLVFALVPTDPKFKARRFPYYCKIQQNQLWKLRDLLVAAGQTVPKKVINIDPSVVVGKLIAAEVEDESNQQYAGRSTINGTYGLDVLDEDGSDDASDDEDEEYEGDEAEEEEYEDEEEEDDEEEVDLSGLGLPALRKMAKDLGIDTAGLKKDELIEAIEEGEAEGDEDDEDDLDDEDLEDEDLDDEEFEDDEEEEEAPAPKRRAAPAKPAARKPAAKAAAPATRRPIRRR